MNKRGNAKKATSNLPVKKRRVQTGDSETDSEEEIIQVTLDHAQEHDEDEDDGTNAALSAGKVNLHEAKWNRMYDLLIAYDKEHGNCRVPSSYTIESEDGKPLKLGLWLSSQRHAKSKQKLKSDRESKLQALVDSGKLEWGEPSVPTTTSSILNAEGSSVLEDSSVAFGLGKSRFSTSASAEAADSSDDEEFYARAQVPMNGTGLIPEDAHDHRWNLHEQRWDTMYSLMLQFCEQNQHCRIPNSYTVPSPMDPSKKLKLGLWLGTQRQLRSKGKLRKDREMKLELLIERGLWTWGETKEDKGDGKWNIYFNALLAWGDQNGHFNIKERDFVTLADGTKLMLGRWLDRQRSIFHRNKLPPLRREKLQALIDSGKLVANVSAEDDKRWLFYFEILKRWGDEHDGNCNAPKHAVVSLEDGTIVKIGKWLGKQRSLRKSKPPAKHLRADRFEMMNELVKAGKLKWMFGMECETRWNMHFEALLQLAAARRNGDCNIPRTEKVMGPDDTPLRLGVWLNKQRENYLTHKLRHDRLMKLQSLADEGRFSWDYDGELPPQISKALLAGGAPGSIEFNNASLYQDGIIPAHLTAGSFEAYPEYDEDEDEDDDENNDDDDSDDEHGAPALAHVLVNDPALSSAEFK